MTHPFDALLSEFAFAIRHFVPTLPAEIKIQAQETLERFKADPSVTEKQIEQAFYEIGVQEYPYRHAYQDLTSGSAKEKLIAMVLEHVDEKVRAVIKPHFDAGVSLDELVRSDIFEAQLTAEQRYQVEDGILVSSLKIADELKTQVDAQEHTYEGLVTKWMNHAKVIQATIDQLEALMEEGNENQKLEIKNKVERYREGFLVTEPDPDLEEVKKEIEYWNDTFHPTE